MWAQSCVRSGPVYSLEGMRGRGSHTPDSLWYVDLLPSMFINVAHQREAGIKALHSEQSADKRVEQPLVKVVVNPNPTRRRRAHLFTLGRKGT